MKINPQSVKINIPNFILAVVLSLSTENLLSAEEIGTAFGVTIGKPFPETISTISKTTNGVIVIHIFKPKNIKYIETVATASFVNDKTNYVCSITGFGNFETKTEQDEAAEVLKGLLETKYTTSTSRKKESVLQRRFSIEQGSHSVSIETEINLSNFPRAHQISVNYADEVLARQIIDYQKRLKIKQTNSDSF